MPSAPLSLKQRLANFANATSAPSTPHSPSRSSFASSSSSGMGFGKKKFFNTSSWNNSASSAFSISSSSGVSNGGEEADKLEEVMQRMIFQAGVDYETRPLVVMNASSFPDPRSVSYDLLLTRILSYLDLFVESDYTVVFFAAGGRNTPSWNWVWKAYRSLSRKYRKNLKRLYIVHSSFFSKMLFSLAGAIISPKFFRKITYIDTLSALSEHVPLTQIDIPPTVYQENLKHESQITTPAAAHSRMFGISLDELMGYDGEKDGLPRVVRDCIQYLRESGMDEEGIFRRSPNSVLLRQVREAYNRGQAVTISSYNDPHLAAVLLKKFLRDLPEPIFPESTYSVIRKCPTPSMKGGSMDSSGLNDTADVAVVEYIREHVLTELPPCTYILLNAILHLMHDVSLRSEKNRMDAHNLAIVLSPNLVASGNPLKDVEICGVAGAPPLTPTNSTGVTSSIGGRGRRGAQQGNMTLGTIVKVCIQRYFEVFDEVPDRGDAINAGSFTEDNSNLSEQISSPSTPSTMDADPMAGPTSPSSPGDTRKRFSTLSSDEEIDDGMLVMPLGPSVSSSSNLNSRSPSSGVRRMAQVFEQGPPSSWSATPMDSSASPLPPALSQQYSYAVRTPRSVKSGGTTQGRLATLGTTSKAKARSLISPSPSNGSANFLSHSSSSSSSVFRSTPSSRMGTLSRSALAKGATMKGKGMTGSESDGSFGTVAKASGAGVTAVGVTAAGFFSPPSAAQRGSVAPMH